MLVTTEKAVGTYGFFAGMGAVAFATRDLVQIFLAQNCELFLIVVSHD
jgi:hypothetical protein